MMNQETVNLIIQKLEVLGVKLSETAIKGVEYFYPIAIRKVIIDGIFQTAISFLLMFLSYKMFKILKKQWVEDEFYDSDLFCAGVLILFILTCFSIFFLYGGINAVFNPQWEVIELLKTTIN